MIKILVIIITFATFIYAASFKDTIKNDSLLSNGMTNFIKYQNKTYLISVGISEIRNNSVQSKINSIKQARILSKANLTKFINSTTIETTENFKSITKIISYNKNFTKVSREEYTEIIKEKGSGVLTNIIDIGKWRIEKEVFYALGILVE